MSSIPSVDEAVEDVVEEQDVLFLLDGIVFIGGYEFICEDGRERKLAIILIISRRKERCAW